MEGEEDKLDPSTSWHVSTSRPPTSNVYSLMSVRFVMRALASGRLRMLLALQQGRAVHMQVRQYALLIATTAAASPVGVLERREALLDGRGTGRERGDDARLGAAAQRILTRGEEGI